MKSNHPKKRRKERARGPKSPRPDGPVFAAIDLGTNNCRLLIARPASGGGFRVIDSFSRIVRLGEGLAETGRLGPAGIERTVAALAICAERLAANRVTHLRAIATEACRRAANAGELVARVRAETGLALDIVTSEEEARLAALGCEPLIGRRYEGALVFDIGGGSTELIWMRKGADRAQSPSSVSLDAGVVTLAETLGADRPLEDYLEAITPMFSGAKKRLEAAAQIDVGAVHLLGTSGTVTTLAGIALGLPHYIRARVDGSWHECADILAIVARLFAMDREARAGLACVGAERADLVLPGCAIFAAIHAEWPCAELRVADRGLRDGMLREQMAEAGI
ncbi:MAG TPA: Ppx/GppA phosphatase family protein [Rhizomicrobium sp.]|nr:Ppx/GppA phosphatase family protein [Rhizomicrobium sp.]